MRDTKAMSEQLEAMIDHTSIRDVVTMLSEICWEKAAHLESNWQDRNQAKLWDHDGKLLDTLVTKLHAAF